MTPAAGAIPEDLAAAKAELRERLFARVVRAHFRASSVERRASAFAVAASPLNLVGVCIGHKRSGDADLPELCVKVLVRKKLPAKEVPRAYRVVKHLAGVPTDVVESGLIRARTGDCRVPTSRQKRPFSAGVSVGGLGVGAGTVGCKMRVPGESGDFILSNYHVLAAVSGPAENGPVFQPGLGDAPLVPENQVGSFARGVPLDFSGGVNLMDAAIARVGHGVVGEDVCRWGAVSTVAEPNLHAPVWMFGKESRGVRGDVNDVDAEIVVHYPGNRIARFDRQVRIRPRVRRSFGLRGDSGSLVLHEEARGACGLYFATDGSGDGFATPIAMVMQALEAELA